MQQVNLLQKNVPLKRALQACSGPHRWKQPRSVQVALGAMHTLILIYTPARLMLAAAGDCPLTNPVAANLGCSAKWLVEGCAQS